MPPSTTVDRNGSSTSTRPNACITSMTSCGAAAEAAVFLGERQPKQAEFGELRPHLRRVALRQRQIRLALRETVVIREQPRDTFDQQPLIVRRIEVHYSPSTALVRMFFWISFVPP